MERFIKSRIRLYTTRKALPIWCVLLADCVIIYLSFIVSVYLIMRAVYLIHNFWNLGLQVLCVLPFFLLGMYRFHTYRGLLRYSTVKDCVQVGKALLTGFAMIVVVCLIFFPAESTQWEVLFLTLLLAFLGQCALRLFVKALYESLSDGSGAKKALIYGAMDGAISIANVVRTLHSSEYSIAGFISISGMRKSRYVMGVKVYDDAPDLMPLINHLKVKALFISPLQIDHFRNRKGLIDHLLSSNVKVMVISDAKEWNGTKAAESSQLKEVDIEDLLPRDKIEVDMDAIGEMLVGKRILITGAAGSIGFEMVKQVARFSPAKLVLIDQAETPMHDVRLYMLRKYPDIDCETIVGSINNATHMETIFSSYKPEYVFHAAAYKHVPMMEDNPAMAVQNNIYGTRVVAELAVRYGTRKFVMISTDKAVNPTNVMGCSKRICEIYCQSLNAYLQEKAKNGEYSNVPTQFITTRFGNVLGSNGSVIPLFKRQIADGGPVTVTHPDIIRFFMLISEACQLVLEAGTMGKGGEIFVFDMGQPVRIADLAKRMIRLSGANDVKIMYTGLREGEKLYEEVLSDAELTKPTVHPKIRVAKVRDYDYKQAVADEEELYRLSQGYDNMRIVRKMKEIVPEYKSQNSKYEAIDADMEKLVGGGKNVVANV